MSLVWRSNGLEFKKLDERMYSQVRCFFETYPMNICEGQLLCAAIWQSYLQLSVAYDDKILWILEGYDGQYSCWLPRCDRSELKYAILSLKEYFETELQAPFIMYAINEENATFLDAEFLKENHLFLEETPDFDDYIYSGEKLRTLSGRKLHKKKNHANAFYRNYEGRYEYRRLGAENKNEILTFLEKWNQKKQEKEPSETLPFEAQGIAAVLANYDLLTPIIGGIYIDGKLAAFSIGSKSETQNMAFIHIEKAWSDIRGLYAVMNQQFLLHEFCDVEKVNREDDMGHASLRQAKQSYHPIEMGKKYVLRSSDQKTK